MPPGTLILSSLLLPASVWAQWRQWDGSWDIHPIWWLLAAGTATLVLLVLFGWALFHFVPLVLLLVGAVLGIRWLIKSRDGARSDSAVAVLRERYARGEINKDEFDAKLRDLRGKA